LNTDFFSLERDIAIPVNFEFGEISSVPEFGRLLIVILIVIVINSNINIIIINTTLTVTVSVTECESLTQSVTGE